MSKKTAEELLEDLGKDFKEYKEKNDQSLKALEENNGTSELKEELAKRDAELDKKNAELKVFADQKAADDEANKARDEKIDSLLAKGGRPGREGKTPEQSDEYKSAFVEEFMRRGREDNLATRSGEAYQGSGEDGGWTIPEGLDTEILTQMRTESPMRRLARVMTVGQAAYSQLVRDGNAGSGWVGETDDRPETDNPRLAKFTPNFGELYANPSVTQQMLDDAFFDVAAWYEEEVAESFAEKEGGSFIVGDGVNKPKGLLVYPTALTDDKTRAYGTVQHRLSEGAGVIGGDDIINLTYDLKASFRQNGVFMMTGTTLATCRKLKNANGDYLWQQSLILGQPSTLSGYAIEEEEEMPAVASGALSIAFGDIAKAYRILDVRGIRTLRDPYTRKPYVQFYSTKRVGGGVANTQAVKLLKVA